MKVCVIYGQGGGGWSKFWERIFWLIWIITQINGQGGEDNS